MQAWKLEEFPQLQQQYERDMLLYESDLATWKKTGRAKVILHRKSPSRRWCKRYLVNDVTDLPPFSVPGVMRVSVVLRCSPTLIQLKG